MVVVVEIQHIDRRETAAGERTYPGARRWELAAGGQVRRIDRDTFEVVATGELLLRDEREPAGDPAAEGRSGPTRCYR